MAFLLRPDIRPEGIVRPDAGSTDLREPMRSAALEAGLVRMHRPPKTPYSIPSLEATEYAKEQGRFDEFHKQCYSAMWDDGLDLSDFGVLEQITRSCGLNWPELEQRLKSGYYHDEITRQYQLGRRLGFSGIPGFVIGNAGFTGAAPYPMFRVAAQRALAEIREEKPRQGEDAGEG